MEWESRDDVDYLSEAEEPEMEIEIDRAPTDPDARSYIMDVYDVVKKEWWGDTDENADCEALKPRDDGVYFIVQYNHVFWGTWKQI